MRGQAEQGLELGLAPAYPREAMIQHWRRAITLDEGLTVTETWTLGAPGRQVRVHLMLARAPEQAGDGSWVLHGPSGWPRSVLTVAHDGPVSVTHELIDLEDPILREVWGRRSPG